MSKEYYHSVMLDETKCKGCTTCIRHCPTQAIRVQNGKAKIIKERCIDCGECIRICAYHAKLAVTDSFDMLMRFKYNIALPAPAFCGQFSKAKDLDTVYTALLSIGFDNVFEVARGAEVITAKTKELLQSGTLLLPAISSACPAVLRLIAVRFPELLAHVVPLTSPMEVAADMARKEAVEQTGLTADEIGVFFISPCAAKMTSVKSPFALKNSAVDGVLAIKDVYLRLAHRIGRIDTVDKLTVAGKSGIRWATDGGEAAALDTERHIAVDGIENVIGVLENLEDNKIKDVDFIEALACIGGCVGGPLCVENNFVANSRIKRMTSSMEDKAASVKDKENLFWDKGIDARPFSPLDEDMAVAMRKMEAMNEIYARLPHLDCGSCGAPTCKALAEDIVRGKANETDCIFKLRERVAELAKEMAELEQKLPPSIGY